MMWTRAGILGSLGALILCAPTIAQPAYYTMAGLPTALSHDGTIAAGTAGSGFFRWTVGGGLVGIGGIFDAGDAGLSEDGMFISGSNLNATTNLSEMAHYDVASGTWTNLGGIGGSSGSNTSSGWGISGDGQSVVGLGWVNAGRAEAIQWRQGGSTTSLGSTVAGSSSRANATDLDGNIVVGWQDASSGFRQAAVWDNGVQTLLFNGTDELSEAGDVTPDGNWVVGSGGFATDFEPWRYNRTTGVLDVLGTINPLNQSRGATGISDDGRAVVGFDRAFGPPIFGQGTIWLEGSGLQNLTAYALSKGVPIPAGVTLALPMAISGDGTTIAGLASNAQGFVIVVPEPTGLGLVGVGLGIMLGRRRCQK